MSSFAKVVRRLLAVLTCSGAWITLPSFALQPPGTLLLVAKEGRVEVLPPGTAPTNWVTCATNQLLQAHWRLRTRENSRATLQWPDLSVVSYGEMAEMEVLPSSAENGSRLRLIQGILSFLHKEEPGDIRVITRGANAGIKGTEFVMAVQQINGIERTTLSVIDGIVTLDNPFGALTLTNGQQAIVDLGQKPVMTAGFVANNILQWAFYYPAVLDLRDLPLTEPETQILASSLAAYRSGDLLAALENYPAERQPASEAERVYRAALFLAVGQIGKTEDALAALPPGEANAPVQRLANALRVLIAAVKREPAPVAIPGSLPTELLAASYYEQSRAAGDISLRTALALARQAATASPEFSFAWARVAELEFSFGRTGAASDALAKSLALADRNAQALALQGFLNAARNRIREAEEWFNRAIAVDPGLGNAWLGRGLIRIRQGDMEGGRADLMVAAAAEPQRSALRSYLAKALAQAGDTPRARHELELAKRLDPADPTPWLYSALVNEEANRINEGIRDLEKSQELNDNRSLYRSKLLLDQDRAVRSANLANIYRDAGMIGWSVQEAGRAVAADYENYSAHLFLANSYDELRDPNRINLRYETPAESEYLIANLLAPVGAGLLSPSVSQQEYSRLFERDRLGVASSTEYLSRGAWIERGAQYGAFKDSSYLFEANYRTDPGERPNGDFEELELRLHLKQQITPKDTLYFRAIYYDAEGGDVRQYYDPKNAHTDLRTHETQEPILHLGYHHEWGPGLHTLVLAGRLNDRYSVTDPIQPSLFILQPPGRRPTDFEQIFANLDYRSTLEMYTAELQQIWKQGDHNTVLGGRFQTGEIHTENSQTFPLVVLSEIRGYFNPNAPLAVQDVHDDFERISAYAYHDWQILEPLRLIAGITWDHLTNPENFRSPPIADHEEAIDHFSPKAGLVWTPQSSTAFRFAWSRSLAGASIDQSFLLEPSQVAGFNQSYRSIIPESVSGSGAGAQFETFAAAIEQRLGTSTYLGISGHWLNSSEERTVGAFRFTRPQVWVRTSDTPQTLDYTEKTLLLSLDQLIEKEWSVGISYRLTHADLASDFTEVPDSAFTAGVRPRENLSAFLHQVALQAGYNSPSGLFAQLQALWSQQSNQGYSPDIPGDEFWQFNAYAGYRFPRRQAELRVGLLNITSQDYRLNPLTLYRELPRSRTLALRFQFSF